MDIRISKKIAWVCCFIGVFFFTPFFTQAATLYLSPAASTYEVGDTFSVRMLVNTVGSESMNAVSASVLFPADKLQLNSISKSNTIVSFWAEEPSYSNQNGSASLEGVVLNPGFQGSQGTIVTLNFKVKAIGRAQLVISSASVLANDGQGTNILTSASGSDIQLVPTSEKPIIEAPVKPAPTTPKPATPTLEATTTDVVVPVEAVAPQEEPVAENWFTTISSQLIAYLSVSVVLASLMFALAFLLVYGWSRLIMFKKRVVRETAEAKTMVRKSFKVLKQDIKDHIMKLERARKRRVLSQEEEDFINQFNEDLNDAEAVITKEIEDIVK
jgi:hypothetical protein